MIVTPEVTALAIELHRVGVTECNRLRAAVGEECAEADFTLLSDTVRTGWFAVAAHVLVAKHCALRERDELHAQELGELLREKDGAS